MIRHIVLFSAGKADDIPRIRDGLARLGRIPSVQHFEVALNEKCDGLSQEIDVIVYGEFATAEALEAYKAHPLYEEAIRLVRPLREIRIAVDYETETAISFTNN